MQMLVNTLVLFGFEIYGIAAEDRRDLAYEVECAIKDSGDREDIRFSFDNIVFGIANPEQIGDMAAKWNDTILANLVQQARTLAAAPSEFKLDSNASHLLYKAAKLADDHFDPYGDCGIIRDNGCGYPVLCTVLRAEDVQDIKDNPQNWASVTMYATP